MTDEGAPDLPSIGRLLGMRFEELEHGRVVISLQTRPDFANPLGTVHGGIAATLLDSVVGCAVHTTLPAGVSYTTHGGMMAASGLRMRLSPTLLRHYSIICQALRGASAKTKKRRT